MSLLLIFDSLTVFSGIIKFIQGKVVSIIEIQSVYSNKNILASSLFVKIPFALWLIVFNRKWLRSLGILTTFLAISATFFMSTRAFYLGTFALTFVIIAYLIIRYIQSHDKYQLRLAGIFLIILTAAFLTFSITERFLYPKSKAADGYAVGVGARLATISDPSGGGGRLDIWKWSGHMVKKNPLLGVGLGNWKIAILEEGNHTIPDFIYPYKAHNDFVETTTETGIFGGLLFIAIFLLTGWSLVRIIIKSPDSDWLPFLFLPAFGLLCYSFDAFFNFPQDRPEIQALFALYTGTAIAVSFLSAGISTKTSSPTPKESPDRFVRIPLLVTFGLVLTLSAFLLIQNFNSLKLQRLVKDDFITGKMTHPASLFLNGFPAIPDLNVEGEPIAVQKARYLLDEKRNKEVIELLRNDKSSPFDGRPEYAMAIAYNNLNNTDSSLVYAQKTYKMKPLFFKNISMLCELLQKKGLTNESEAIIDQYLQKTKTNQEAWLFAASFYDRTGNTLKSVAVIDSAAIYFPADSLVLKQKAFLDRKFIMLPYQDTYNSASAAFNAKNYAQASRYFSEILSKEPGFIEARAFRAYCYYMLSEYKSSISDLDYIISSGKPAPTLYNLYDLLGSNYYNLGNQEEACKNYKIAADMGDKNGSSNYSKLCQKVK
jgi:tetratricopeptide (TPR) repeat protein